MNKGRRNTKQIKNVKCQMSNECIFKYLIKIIIIPSFVILSFVICHYSFASAKEFDGIWFMGFNLNQEIVKDIKVRQAINHCVNKEIILKEIVSKETNPTGFIPPSMLGYDPDLDPYIYSIKTAKLLMQEAGYPVDDKRLKKLTLLHTDGIKTIAIAQKIQNDLRNIGIKIELVKVSYMEEEKWITELTSGKHDFFLMGYKAGIENLFNEKGTSSTVDSYNLIEPLFGTKGDANFTGYSDPNVDALLEKTAGLDMALKSERHVKLKEINNILYKDLPAVILFYIETL